MVEDSFIIRCDKCGTKNRIPRSRSTDRAVCGKCRAPLHFTTGYPRYAIAVDERTFENEVIRFPGPVVVLFWATWCGHCRGLLPLVDQLASEYTGLVKFVKVDLDKNQSLASRYQVQSVPTMIEFKNGMLFNRILGAVPKDQIVHHLQAILQK